MQISFMWYTYNQINQRCQLNTGTEWEVVVALKTLFDQHNELIRLFSVFLERMLSDDYKIVVRADKTPIGQHVR